MKSLVLVRGGGDIASGIIYRLVRSGYRVVVNEIAIPTMIRREVCYGTAVHKGVVTLERLTAECVPLTRVQEILLRGHIPVVIEPYRDLLDILEPRIVVDAIMAKKNLGTRADDASLVVGVGPGFIAGESVDVVVETMRGHTLGRCIYEGSAIPNTGVPGNIGGYTHERVMHSPCAGLFTAKRHIGESVKKGDTIGYVDGTPITAKITGILRGILTSGLMVTKHCKLADIDPRCEEFHCYTISDKALAVGGGVVEAVESWYCTKGRNL
ncbi:selenium-dependent molybdenum cofactor biosynthesis protein YqeB [Veillonella montpellierensis]|uniref:selenium-dependent molybdenum cofactor biosynthesis protein YqeB n=1 Tax=Veillonella montpellierensis TaxID=187328 RepID=UPI0023F77E89|nr:selenium-dependent molybdenum cofactor biosynthesis protein YqeB [Veillonella montpellierensis]